MLDARVKDQPRPRSPGERGADPHLRIAFLSYRSDPKVGGQGVYLAQAADALARRGHSVDVLSGPPYPELSHRVRLIKLPSLDLYSQPHNGHLALRWRHLKSLTDVAEYLAHLSGKFMEPWSFGRRAAKYLKAHRGDYDVALDNQSLATGLLEIERTGLPVVEVVHHPIRRDLELALKAEPKWGMRWLARRWYGFLKMQEKVAPRLKDVIVVSKTSGRDVAECLGVRSEALTVIPLGVDQEVFKPQPDIRRRDNRLLTTASADVPLKGLSILIQAYSRLLMQRPDLELVVIGKLRDGPTADLLRVLDLTERVQFISDLTRQQVVEEYAKATLCITPSLYEGFGLPAAEAMCCAAPVVVSDGGALPEVVGDGGVVVRKGDVDALADVIAQLLADPVRRADLAQAARRHARTAFDWDRAAAAYETVLFRAMARKAC